MEKKPEDRFQSAMELAEALTPFSSTKSSAGTAPPDALPATAPVVKVNEPKSPSPDPQAVSRSSQTDRPRRFYQLAGGAAAFIVLLGVIVITITGKDGQKTTVKIPEGTPVEVDPAPGSKVSITKPPRATLPSFRRRSLTHRGISRSDSPRCVCRDPIAEARSRCAVHDRSLGHTTGRESRRQACRRLARPLQSVCEPSRTELVVWFVTQWWAFSVLVVSGASCPRSSNPSGCRSDRPGVSAVCRWTTSREQSGARQSTGRSASAIQSQLIQTTVFRRLRRSARLPSRTLRRELRAEDSMGTRC